MDLKVVIFRLEIIDLGALFGSNYKYGSKNHPFRMIKMGHVSDASVAHPYQKVWESTTVPGNKTGKNRWQFLTEIEQVDLLTVYFYVSRFCG